MGMYLNPGKKRFEMSVSSEIFIDKTEMIRYINSLINTNQRYVCVSRPRRFGKTMAADMLCAYYGREADSRELFEKRKIAENRPSQITDQTDAWDAYLGKFDVIRLVMTDFINSRRSVTEAISTLRLRLLEDLSEAYPDTRYDEADFQYSFEKFYRQSQTPFVIIIDEWDAVFREYPEDKEGQKKYLDFLRDWLKDKEYVALAYMTGILPIKKYGKHSALNMFDEYSMLQPMQMASYTGFTENEVRDLCDTFEMSYPEISEWYDGYCISDWVPVGKRKMYRGGNYEEHRLRIYSPLSVVKAMRNGEICNYWNETETFEALKQYVDWNFDGLKEEVAILMDGGRVSVDVTGYQNDMTTFHSKDDILTMFVHLGYLGYDSDTKKVFIPNQEVLQVFKTSTKSREWTATFRALANSRKLLEATWACDEETVAELLEAAHDRTGNKSYHSEAGLSYAVRLAYYAAQDDYTLIPELDTGKGYADLVYIPKKPDLPALLVELKYEKDANTAIEQIHRQKYPERLEHYRGKLILVGINYDRNLPNDKPGFKHHSCRIERG